MIGAIAFRDALTSAERHPMKLLILLLSLCVALPVGAQERRNVFGDPFQQVTSALPGCPAPAPPGFTEDEAKAEAHVRSHHGTSCFRSGRCRLPNSYLYDKEIIPRVAQYIRMDGRFEDTSVWALGERRLVTLLGCVRTREQAEALERAVMQVDDVMGVINHLQVGVRAKPRYRVANETKAR
jgi:hypothetical protein